MGLESFESETPTFPHFYKGGGVAKKINPERIYNLQNFLYLGTFKKNVDYRKKVQISFG